MPSIRVILVPIEYTGGLTGIGTTNPAARLDVVGHQQQKTLLIQEYQPLESIKVSQVEAKITNNITIDNRMVVLLVP